MTAHEYTSTACLHGKCGSCRNTCKYCDQSCQHECHPQQGELPVSWLDQARDIARELLGLARDVNEDIPGHGPLPPFEERLRTDPDLFWLRGEVPPDGTWQPPQD